MHIHLIMWCAFGLWYLNAFGKKMLIQRDCQWWKWHNLEQHYGCSNASVLLFSIWTDRGMQSFNNFTYECRRQALVFHSERQTDEPAFRENVCSSVLMFGRMVLNTHRERGMKKKRDRENYFKPHVTSHIWSDQVWGNTVWISNWIFQVFAFTNVFDIIFGLSQTVMCEITVCLL